RRASSAVIARSRTSRTEALRALNRTAAAVSFAVFASKSKVVARPGMARGSPRKIYLTADDRGGGFTRNAGCRSGGRSALERGRLRRDGALSEFDDYAVYAGHGRH